MFKLLTLCSFLLFVQLSSQLFAGQVTTFIYHRFDESRYPSTNIASDIFKQQLEYLKKNQRNVISLEETVKRIAAGTSLPDRAVALCADDAYRSFYEVALPLIKQYGYPMTLFVNTDAVGTSGYLSWEEIKEIAAQGVTIGNHTASHLYLVESEEGESFEAWRQRVKNDILKAQDVIASQIGVRPELFAYTFGEYSSEVVEIAREIGFLAAYAQQSGVIHDKNPLFNLPRFPMGGPYATLEGFVNKLKMTPLVVSEQQPFESVVTNNPPVLDIKVENGIYSPKRYNCFVQGENRCWVERLPGGDDGWLRVQAEQPLTGRRNKYTLTVQDSQGQWSWFSQPWVNAKKPMLKR